MKTKTEKIAELLRSEKSELERRLPGRRIALTIDIGTRGHITFRAYCSDEGGGTEIRAHTESATLEGAASKMLAKLDPATQAAELHRQADAIAAQIAKLESAKG